MIDDPDLMRHGGNRESIAAHESIKEYKQRVRRQVYLFAKKRGKHGITADEVSAEFRSTHNHVAPRITELKALGLLIETDKRRPTRTGRWARVLVAVKLQKESAR